MATATERARLRRDIGANATSLPDPDADAIYAEADEKYSDADARNAHARVIAILGILASSAKMTAYRQNNSSVDADKIFEHLKDLLDIWEKREQGAASLAGGGSARFGGLRRKPRRIKEYPG